MTAVAIGSQIMHMIIIMIIGLAMGASPVRPSGYLFIKEDMYK